jgi:hypothetical protein
VFRRIWDAEEEKGIYGEVREGTPTKVLLSLRLCDLAHDYVLTKYKNYESMDIVNSFQPPYICNFSKSIFRSTIDSNNLWQFL